MNTTKQCSHCGKQGSDLKRCGKCKSVYYCSRDCQGLQWKTHKLVCRAPDPPAQTADVPSGGDGASGRNRPHVPREKTGPKFKRNSARADNFPFKFKISTNGPFDDFVVDIDAKYPPCPLQPNELQCLVRKLKSAPISTSLFDKPASGSFTFVTDFRKVKEEWEETLGFDPEWAWAAVLVAKITKLDIYQARFGTVISDENDKQLVVYFHMPSDNPWPYFKLENLRPGNYICIRGPFLHGFVDGQVGFRVNTPDTVRILSADGLCLGYCGH